MALFLHSSYPSAFRKCCHWFLALAWVLGLGFGTVIFRYTGSVFVSLVPLAAKSQPSIVGLLISGFLPFLFSAFAVYISAPRLLYGICIGKAFLLAYAVCGIHAAFPGSGWLIRWLLLFTDCCSAGLLYHYWQRHISGLRGFSARALAIYGGLIFLAAVVDQSYISPLLRVVLS